MKIYSKQFNILEGFKAAHNHKALHIDLSPGHKLFEQSFQAIGDIKCWCCGLRADRWVTDKHRNDLVSRPTLNPYAIHQSQLVMMNRDHIIPRSLGGLNVLENLRVACETCNSLRANSLNAVDKKFIINNMHLFSWEAFHKNRQKMEDAIQRNDYTKRVIKRMRKPFNEVEKLVS